MPPSSRSSLGRLFCEASVPQDLAASRVGSVYQDLAGSAVDLSITSTHKAADFPCLAVSQHQHGITVRIPDDLGGAVRSILDMYRALEVRGINYRATGQFLIARFNVDRLHRGQYFRL